MFPRFNKETASLDLAIPIATMHKGKRSAGGQGATDIYYSQTSPIVMCAVPGEAEEQPVVIQITVRSPKKYDTKKGG